jgi:hypothetical protein
MGCEQMNTDAFWSSTEDNEGNKGMKHRQISSSKTAQGSRREPSFPSVPQSRAINFGARNIAGCAGDARRFRKHTTKESN